MRMTLGTTLGPKFKTWCLAVAIAGVCSACDKQEDAAGTTQETSVKAEAQETQTTVADESSKQVKTPTIEEIMGDQVDELKSRYGARKPKETLEFFGIQPGMTVAEVLPGDGWYSKLLVPFLGKQGKLIAIDYPYAIWHHFNWAKRDFITERKTWPASWEQKANAWYADSWYTEHAAPVTAYAFDSIPEEINEQVDAVLFIRALHNLVRFEERGQFFTSSLTRTHDILKKDGLLCVIQHQAPDDKSDEWADGSRGYLKKADLIKKIEAFGFTFVKESDMHHNALDIPGDDDNVWRLPPALSTSQEDEALREKMKAIGESNRMTLLFKKS